MLVSVQRRLIDFVDCQGWARATIVWFVPPNQALFCVVDGVVQGQSLIGRWRYFLS